MQNSITNNNKTNINILVNPFAPFLSKLGILAYPISIIVRFK